MEKEQIRQQVWDDLEESGTARFPYPPHDRIPNFAGADAAADRLTESDEWQAARTVKANPDAPQLPVRRAALRAGKTLYVAVPRLRDERCFVELDPEAVTDIDDATTVGGLADAGVAVGPDELPHVDLVVSGSVAVSEDGARIGKGEGYSDLEFGVLAEFDRVDARTTVATTVHERQVRGEALPHDEHDVPMDLVVTPERTVRPAGDGRRPSGIDWRALPEERIDEIPVLQRLQDEIR
ncbi:5-formyltetrahydrofolate cyclo-ligase [Haloarchaeobius sp. FL176]|uniref:5-formyltetrahydrofolate cyclo-ligase n=1 Tax=Haloarchaeobius sp. FL176 TaxID=2967129 RepID=UPI00214994D7|nr:5-formyltetrahydrofolate cyclo-ligase [Haloarchaeobius sp. FL176]